MGYSSLEIEEIGTVVILTVNRPEKLNALSSEVLKELRDFLTALKGSDKVFSGMILTGKGEKSFVAGADIREMNAMNEDEGEAFGALGQEVTTLFESLPIPVVACVNGFAFGGGCEMALACDIIYAVESAQFAQPEVNLGLIPGFGGCVRLIRRVGPGRAKEMIYSGRRFSAQDAERIGLVDRVFATREEMLAQATRLLAEIAQKSSFAVSICKAVINEADGTEICDGLLAEKRGFRSAFSHEHMKLGTRAFLDRKTPQFTDIPMLNLNAVGEEAKSWRSAAGPTSRRR
jgi:enoyl-CoA hydratase